MSRTWLDPNVLWPALPPEWLLAETPDWIALDKPTEVVAPPGKERLGASGPTLRNDVFSRLRMHWQAAGLVLPAHPMALVFDPIDGRLEPGPQAGAAVSGVVVIARRDEALHELTRQEAQGKVQLRYVVGVTRWPSKLEPERRDVIAKRLQYLGIRLEASRTEGPRTLLTLGLASGRVVDLARELRGVGVLVAADEEADGSAHEGAERLMVHRMAVSMPWSELQAPVPPAFAQWLRDARADVPLDERLDSALRRRFVLGHGSDTNAFRLLDSAGDDLAVDRYGPDLVLHQVIDLQMNAAAEVVQKALAASLQVARHVGERLQARSVYLKLRPRQANTVVDPVAAGLAPRTPVYGTAPGDEQGLEVVQENGLRLRVRLGAGLGTGLYLDQRDNRKWVRDHAAGLRVLNTFAYTCAFTVAAAVGGASQTLSLDASAGALEEGRANLKLNGHDDEHRHQLLRGDVLHWLPRLQRRGDRFDLIILDPPSYSRVKTRRFSAATDYAELVAAAAGLLAPRGLLLACTNHAGIDHKRLHQMVLHGAHLAGRRLSGVNHRPTALDHPSGRMKALVARFE